MTKVKAGATETIFRQRDLRLAQVLSILSRAADAHKPCPTNDEISDETGLPQASSVVAVIGELRDLGIIEVNAKGGYRSITIVETGKCTDWTTRPKRYFTRAAAAFDGEGNRIANGSFRGDLPPERYIDRTPCGFCGIRADVGCRHSRRLVA